jgi:O-antigen/teichoic acid export membrane protein
MTEKPYNTIWIRRGTWAIADQGLFAMANVLLNVMLARWLVPAEYGAFAVGYSIFLFIGAIHTGLITEPLLVFGAGKYLKRLRDYLSVLVGGHWTLTAIGSLLLAGAGLVARFKGHQHLAQAFFGLAVATPFSLLMWFARRAAYVRFQPRLACSASAVNLVLLLSGLTALGTLHQVSIFSALAMMGAASFVSGLWLLRRLIGDVRQAFLPVSSRYEQIYRQEKRQSETDDKESVMAWKQVAADHWRYGRWSTATAFVMWVPLNFFFVVLSVYVNFESSASLKALVNLVLPLLQANAALGSLLLPAMVARAANRELFKKLLRSSLCLFAGGALLYSLVIGMFSRPLVHLLYDGAYDGHTSGLFLLLVIPILDGALVVLACALRSQARPDRVFWGHLTVALFVLSGGVVATQAAGLKGAAVAMIFADLLGVAILGAGVLAQLRDAPDKRLAVESFQGALEAAS